MMVHKLVACVIFAVLCDYVTTSHFCGKCSPKSGVKCIDEDTFIFCDRNGVETTRAASCPAGQKCVNSMHICGKVKHGECKNKCKDCSNGRFTCISRTAFSLCFGRNQTSQVAAKCNVGKVCSTAKFEASSRNPVLDFCFDELSLEHHEIDCHDHEAPTFVPALPPKGEVRPTGYPVYPMPGLSYPAFTDPPPVPEEEPYHFCNGRKAGKYQITTDRKCQKYYICYHNGTQMTGDIYSCAEHSVFDPKSQKCILPTFNFYKNNKCGSNADSASHRSAMNYMSPAHNAIPITHGTPLNQMGYLSWPNYVHPGYPAMQPWRMQNYYYPMNYARTNPYLATRHQNPNGYYMVPKQIPNYHQPVSGNLESPRDQSQPIEVWDEVIEPTISEPPKQYQPVGNTRNVFFGVGTSL